jgi:AAA domain
MAATAIAASEEGPDFGAHAHAPKLTPRELAQYQEALESLVRTIRKAQPGLEEIVFRNMASQAAGYIHGGFSRQIVIDRLNEAARSVGLTPNAEDLIDGCITAAAANGVAPDCPLVPAKRNDRDRLKLIRWSDLHRLPKREALVEGLLDCGAFSPMFGPSGCGKTFFALDLAAHVALGRAWRGMPVLQGAVVYVAAEGGFGILDRLTAFSRRHGIDPKNAPLYVVPDR